MDNSGVPSQKEMNLVLAATGLLLVLGKNPCIASDCSCKKNGTRNDWELVLNSIFPDNYNPEESPSINNEQTVINVTFQFWSLTGLSISKQLFEAEFGIIASWSDNRLLPVSASHSKRKRIPVPKTIVDRLWVPTVFFAGCRMCDDRDELFRGKKRQLHYLPEKMEFQVMFGETKTFICNLHLAAYPFDGHECIIGLQFFDHTLNNAAVMLRDVKLHWIRDTPETFVAWFGAPPEFVFDGLRRDNTCSIQQRQLTHNDCLAYKVRFHRRIGHHLILVYIPTMMIVSASWISFWLEANAAAPRVTLGMTNLLTLTGIFSTSQEGLARFSYVKALDVWIIACIFIVFASLLEFAYVFHTRKSVAAGVIHSLKEENNKTPTEITPLSTDQRTNHKQESNSMTTKAHWMDVASRYVFPAAFILFNAFYWVICGLCIR